MTFYDGGIEYVPNVGEAPLPNFGLAINASSQMLYDGYASTWTTFSPSYTNLTVGNGTVVAKYHDIHGRVHCRWAITLGSTSSISGRVNVDQGASYHGAYNQFGRGAAFDTSASRWYPVGVHIDSTTDAAIFQTSSTVPFTWATGDILAGEWSARPPINMGDIRGI